MSPDFVGSKKNSVEASPQAEDQQARDFSC